MNLLRSTNPTPAPEGNFQDDAVVAIPSAELLQTATEAAENRNEKCVELVFFIFHVYFSIFFCMSEKVQVQIFKKIDVKSSFLFL